MWEWWSNKLMFAIIFILVLIIVGFWFFPDATKEVVGNMVRAAKPITIGFFDLVKNLVSKFIS
jgi:hypothetical protein